jgi:hypothetical protein
MLRVLQISAAVFPLSAYSVFAKVTFEAFGLRFGRPPDFPRALAAASPAIVRSLMRFRSNSESAPKMWKISCPVAEEVSMASVTLRKAIRWEARWFTVSMRCVRERARRSSARQPRCHRV